jgi:hypothetical protein
LGTYLALAWRRQTEYQAGLVQHISKAAEHRFTALRSCSVNRPARTGV